MMQNDYITYKYKLKSCAINILVMANKQHQDKRKIRHDDADQD